MQEELLQFPNLPVIKGRGAVDNPENRFEKRKIEVDPEWLEYACERKVKTEYFVDTSQQILAKNDSPDIPFTYSLNPYRGCEHGCIYCYARPSHEFFGWSCGLDFETKIMVKPNAPELLERKFQSSGWQPQMVALSGNSDCYQLIEKQMHITRRCLEVFLKYRNPVGIVTKSDLILRDLDILQELAKLDLVMTNVSVTTLDNRVARKMEPRASSPLNRLTVLEKLAAAGIPAGVFVAPVIPGLTDQEMPAILEAAARCGAKNAACILLRLPYGVKGLFQTWLQEHFPDRLNKVLHAVQDTRAGKLNDPALGFVRAEKVCAPGRFR
ncbi:MAG: PA0069 family radical SAM protein [bacterium]